jgi:hypothetical protein
MTDPTLPLSGLSPVSGKTVITKFDGGLLSSDGGVMALREVEQRLRVARTPGFWLWPACGPGGPASGYLLEPIAIIALVVTLGEQAACRRRNSRWRIMGR